MYSIIDPKSKICQYFNLQIYRSCTDKVQWCSTQQKTIPKVLASIDVLMNETMHGEWKNKINGFSANGANTKFGRWLNIFNKLSTETHPD